MQTWGMADPSTPSLHVQSFSGPVIEGVVVGHGEDWRKVPRANNNLIR